LFLRREFLGLRRAARYFLMVDYFALLGEPRRPFLDPERIKETFHRLSRTRHPDQQANDAVSGDGDNGDFAALNLAQQTLRDPKARLRHLLELEHPQIRTSGPAAVPATLADQFAPVHQLLKGIEGFLPRKEAATSALTKALLAREAGTLRAQAQDRLAQLEAQHAAALADLQAFDAGWEAYGQSPDAAARLVEFYQRFAYLARWIEQLRERLFQLDY
jgi:curved DNA-binding protein CbpA